MFLMKKMKFIIFSSIFLFSIISKTSSYTANYQTSFEKRLSFQNLNTPLHQNKDVKHNQEKSGEKQSEKSIFKYKNVLFFLRYF